MIDMAKYVDPTDGATASYVKPSVYQSHLGKIWIVVPSGGFRKEEWFSALYEREGFGTWERALASALEIARDRIGRGLAEYRRRKQHAEDYDYDPYDEPEDYDGYIDWLREGHGEQ